MRAHVRMCVRAYLVLFAVFGTHTTCIKEKNRGRRMRAYTVSKPVPTQAWNAGKHGPATLNQRERNVSPWFVVPVATHIIHYNWIEAFVRIYRDDVEVK